MSLARIAAFAPLVALMSVMAVSDSASSPPNGGAAGALAAFTSDDPLILDARRLVEHGSFAEAERLLRAADAGAHPAAAEMLEVIARIRTAYSLDADALLSKLHASIPHVTAADLERWRMLGQVQFRVIDGRVAYFAREPANVFRICEEAKARRGPQPSPETATTQPGAWKLEDHLARVIETARREGRADVLPIRHRVRFTLTIAPDAQHLRLGAMVRVWLPFPQPYGCRQGDVKLISTSPELALLAPAATGDGPRLDGAPQRSTYFEQRVAESSAGKPLTFEELFEFTSSAYYPNLDDSKARALPADWAGRDLGERPPHIVFTSQVRQAVAQIVGNESNPLIVARRIYQFVTRNIAYCAEEEYSTIPSLPAKALASRRGDCGVYGMLFITLCRCAGIPARWQSGVETKRVGLDIHDWAEFYVAPWGWLPADPSYGANFKDNPDPQLRDFYFGHIDSYRLIVNRDYGCPLVPPKQSVRSEPLDFQRGEVEIVDPDGTAHNLYYTHWDYDLDVQWLDEGP